MALRRIATILKHSSKAGILSLSAMTVAIGLSGCVSTQSNVFSTQKSQQEALSAQVQLARSYMGRGNWELAKRKLKTAHDMDPEAPEVHEAMALVSQNTGEYELAEFHFKRALSLKKDFTRARNNYAAFLYGRERTAEACDQLDQVVSDSLYVSRAHGFYNLALCRITLGDDKAAEEALLRVVAMDEAHTAASLELADLYFEREDLQSAARYYEMHKRRVRSQSARALWLGIRLSDGLKDYNGMASQVLALRNLYPQSAEYAEYERRYVKD